MTEREQDKLALKYCGVMGHLVAAVRTFPDGTVHSVGEFNDESEARRLLGSTIAAQKIRLYQKNRRSYQIMEGK